MVDQTDLEHLRLLRIGYFVNAGLLAIVFLFPIVHLMIGVLILAGVMDEGQNPPPRFVGLFFIVIALVIMAGAAAMGICNLLVARSLRDHTRYTFCVVVAALNLMFSPLGLIIGIFSLIVLMRDSVKQLFLRSAPPMTGEMPNWR
jgi:hypothetical protein